MKAKLTGIVLFHLFWADEVWSQTSRSDPNDKQARYGINLSVDLPKKWETNFSYQARYRNDFQDFRGGYFTFGLQKEILKNLSPLAEYRIAWLNNSTYHRITAGLIYKQHIHKLKLSLRGLAQNQMEEFDDTNKEDTHDLYWRVKLNALYPLMKRLTMHASAEPVMMVNGIHNLNSWRSVVGLKFEIIRKLDIDLYYLNKQDYSKSYDRTIDIFGVGLDYTLKL
jgi:hypothetical protein